MTVPADDSLDLQVAHAEIAAGHLAVTIDDSGVPKIVGSDGIHSERFRPSVRWDHAGPIIEREGLSVARAASGLWVAFVPGQLLGRYWSGKTPLIAAMRTYVALAEDPKPDSPVAGAP